MLLKILFLLFLLLASCRSWGLVKDPIYDDLEGYELVAALIKDGKYDLAQKELAAKKLKTEEPSRYHQLWGELHYGRGEWKKSLKSLAEVKDPGRQDVATLYKARNFFQMESYELCAEHFRQLDMDRFAAESDFLWKSQCERLSKNYQAAWKTLLAAEQRRPSFSLTTEMVATQIRWQLAHEAYSRALKWFAAMPGLPGQYLTVAEMFHQAGYGDFAVGVLEMARVHHPAHADINLTLSQLYFQRGSLWAAEEGFARAALSEAKYFYHTAEMNRQLGRYERAVYFNGRIVDSKERLKQKIAGYVDSGKFPMIASLEAVIKRSELAQDDEIRYALAYSLVKMGQVEEPLKMLAAITKPELMEKTTVLRKTLIDCHEKKELCKL